MKKLLSIVLCLTMIATLFTGTFAMTANAVVATPVQSASDSYVFADYTTTELGYKAVTNSDNLSYSLDMSKVDLNTKYQIRMTATAVANEEGTAVTGWVYSNVIVDGVYGKRTWDNGEIRVTASGAEYATTSTQYLSLDTLSGYGQQITLQICPRNFTTGVLHLEKLELVPATDTSSNGGYVLSTGYDEERATTIYTAYAEEGFEVGSITAMSQFRSTTSGRDYQYMNCGVEIINKVSSREVQFVVDITDTGDEGDYGHMVIYGRGFITASFFERTKPAQSPSESVPVYEFTEANVPTGTGNSWDAEKGAFKFDIDDKYAANSSAGEYALDVNLTIPASKMDASTNYAIRVNYEATEGFTMWTYFHVYADGSMINRGIHNGEARLMSSHMDVSSTTSLDSIDDISVYGSNMNMYLRMRVTAANAKAMVDSGREDNAIWIKSVELVPTENNGDAHGYVLVTGYDTDTGRAIFTAYPEEGYEVGTISATVYDSSAAAPNSPITIYTFDEIESGADYYKFSIDRTKPDGSGTYVKYLQIGDYVNVSFVESDVVPMLSPEESYVLYDFDTEDQLADWSGGRIETDPEFAYGGTGGSLAYDGTVSSDYNIYLDAADIAHFDANNRYYIELEFSAEPTASAIVYVNTFYDFGFATGSISRTWYENHADVVGTGPNKVYISGDDTYSTYRSTSTIPVVGNAVRLQFCIRNTGTGVIQLDNIRLVPEYDRTGAHGYVQSSYNAVTDTVDFIATAEEGYIINELTMTKPASGIGADLCAKLGIGAYDNYTWRYKATEKVSATQTLFSLTYDDMFPESGFIVCDNGAKPFIRAEFIEITDMAGDATSDMQVNVLDLVRIKNYVAGNDVTVNETNCDINADGTIDINDIVALRKIILGIA